MKKIILFIFIGIIFVSCQKDEYEIADKEAINLLVYDREIISKPYRFSSYFEVLTRAGSDLYISTVSESGDLDQTGPLEKKILEGKSLDSLSRFSVLHSFEEEKIISFVYTDSIMLEGYKTEVEIVKIVKINVDATIEWEVNDTMLIDNNYVIFDLYYFDTYILESGDIVLTNYIYGDIGGGFGNYILFKHFDSDGNKIKEVYSDYLGAGEPAAFFSMESQGAFVSVSRDAFSFSLVNTISLIDADGHLLGEFENSLNFIELHHTAQISFSEIVVSGLVPNLEDLKLNSFVALVNVSGQIVWNTILPFNKNMLVNDILLLDDGYLVVGSTVDDRAQYVYDWSKVYDYGRANMVWIKLNKQGEIVWQNSLTGDSSDIGASVIKNKAGGFSILGARLSYMQFKNMALLKIKEDGNFK